MARKPTRAKAAKPAKARAVKRPPEVSAADWKKWSPAYRKRAAGFYKAHPGAPRYQMRGKQTGESRTLAARRADRVRSRAERQHYRGQKYGARSVAAIEASYWAVIRDHGWQAFGAIERQIDANHARWTQHGSPRKGDKASLGLTPAEYMPDDFDWEDYGGEESEFFYH